MKKKVRKVDFYIKNDRLARELLFIIYNVHFSLHYVSPSTRFLHRGISATEQEVQR